MQIEALAELRRGGEQQVTVKHVHVHQGDPGQAIIGDVHVAGGWGTDITRGNPMDRTQEPMSLRLAVRCGARNRAGNPCQSPAVKGRARCRLRRSARQWRTVR